MKYQLVDLLRCPSCQGDLSVIDAREVDGEVESGTLTCDRCGSQYPIVGFVPRFVPAENYAGNFGFQWNRFRRTQLDSHSGLPVSRDRFFRQSGWSPEELGGRRVLDVGCGAGRFAEIALSCGANLVALDYSSAVDACWANHGPNPNLNVVQGDVYHLPFKPGAFDFVYCFGVLQHTPDVEKAFLALPAQLSPGGRLAVDVYPQLLLNALWPRYWLHPLTKRLSPAVLFRLVQIMVPILLPASMLIGRVPIVGHKLSHVVPVANYKGVYPLSSAQLKEWAVLDTFDMLSPAHDHPQSSGTLHTWFVRAGLRDIEVSRPGLLVGRGIK